MSRRDKAVSILRKFQAALGERLTDLVIEHEDNLMDEVDQDFGLTNDIYDLAEKLRVVSVTLGVLPAEKHEPVSQDSEQVVVVMTGQRITINDFLLMIEIQDFHRASVALAYLLGTTVERAQRCVQHFLLTLEMDRHPLTEQDSMNKLTELQKCSSMTRAIELAKDVFGLSPPEALIAIQSLRT